jgi:lipoprotein-anchoring transpeptidase ErfK/SrfK
MPIPELRVPVDPESLAAFGDLAARHDETIASPDPEPRPVGAPYASSAVPEAASRDPLALLHAVDPATRQRVLALGVGSVLAGLVCGLLVPATADAAAPATTRASAALSLASASPFHATTPSRALPVTGRAPARTAAEARAAGSSPAHVAVLLAADGARPSTRSAVVRAAGAWHVTRALPAASGTGRRIVYAERSAHLWVVGADGIVLRDYKVTGRIDRPRAGTYHVWSKSEHTSNPKEKLTFDLMVRFARGYTGAPIGFHTIPRTYSGHPIQSESQLGTPVGRGGCVRQSRIDATWLYSWVRVGDTVVVLR